MRRAALMVVLCLLVAVWTEAGRSSDPGAAGPPSRRAGPPSRPAEPAAAAEARLREPPAGAWVIPGAGGAALAVAASQALFDSAPVVVLASVGDWTGQAAAASVAVALGAPMLLTPDAAAALASSSPEADPTLGEVGRLGSTAVLAVGARAARWADGLPNVDVVVAPEDPAQLTSVTRAELAAPTEVSAAGLLRAVAALPRGSAPPLLSTDTAAPSSAPLTRGEADRLPPVTAPAPLGGVVVLASAETAEPVAAVATARAAGADVLVMDQHDPRGDQQVIDTLSTRPPTSVSALGDAFGDRDRLSRRLAVATTGTLLPGGGQLVVPGKRYVALYGHPGAPALGVLGEQDVDGAISRAKAVAASYAAAGSPEPVIPTFEIITTIASADAGGDGDYSSEASLERLRPWVDAAGAAGVYVVLDLQPGRTDFLTQAKRYEQLLALPHVGLALDPEWRLAPGQRHLAEVGTVSAEEVNAVIDWLATLTAAGELPQKMLLLHQFRTTMLADRDRIDTGRDELGLVVQMDGHGPPGSKMATWRTITAAPPAGMSFGWKNFYDEDTPTLTPAQTLAVRPTPVFVSYQ